MNKLIEITKEITRLWHEGVHDPYEELKALGYDIEDIRTVVFILKEGNKNMMEGRKQIRPKIKRGDSDKWTSFT